MPESNGVDVAVVGGGLVGLATARALAARGGLRIVLLEAEEEVARHQTGHNSGVLHTGLYYPPGSVKARTCRAGRRALMDFCAARGIPVAVRGKLVTATREEELPRLAELERRGRENGLLGLRRLSAAEIPDVEPHAAGVAALHVPEAAVVDFRAVARGVAEELEKAGTRVIRGAPLLGVARSGGALRLETARETLSARLLVACAGLHADRVARLSGLTPEVAILPFRGDYFEVIPERRDLVRSLVYPVPDPRFPFLGVHFTRRVDDALEVGPNAVLALHRTAYRRLAFSPRDAVSAALFPGLWRFLAAHPRESAGELRRAFDAGAFLAAARRLVPALRAADVRRAGCGIRAQAMRRDGTLVEDFEFLEAEGMLHVLNAPSPAATASFAIGEEIASRAAARLA